MRCAELLGQVLHGFSDNFQAAYEGTPQRLIRSETLEAQTRTLTEQVFGNKRGHSSFSLKTCEVGPAVEG
jgi:hypothetical protein